MALDRLEDVLATTCAINSAGVCRPVALEALDGPSWQEVIDINLTGSFHVAREAGLRMRRRAGGSIVNVASELSAPLQFRPRWGEAGCRGAVRRTTCSRA
jgi:NAD(P)-dependent dehydrogenase (short-subunit alcohol dehydrogenase family)